MGDIIPTSSSSPGSQAVQATRSLGLSYHLADVWLPELRKVAGEGPLPPEGLAALLEPFVGVLQHSGEAALINRVRWVCVGAAVKQQSNSSQVSALGDKRCVGGGACGWGCCLLCRRAGCVCGTCAYVCSCAAVKGVRHLGTIFACWWGVSLQL